MALLLNSTKCLKKNEHQYSNSSKKLKIKRWKIFRIHSIKPIIILVPKLDKNITKKNYKYPSRKNPQQKLTNQNK